MPEIGIFIATQIASYFIKKGLDKVLKIKPETFQKRLARIIDNTIDDYSREHPTPDKGGKFPFYKSQIIIDELFKYRFFKSNGYSFNKDFIQQELRTNPNIIGSKGDEIVRFLTIFEKKLKADSNLGQLAIKENYQEEIFEISKSVTLLIEEFHEILRNTEEILQKIEVKAKISGDLPKELTSLPRRKKVDIIGRSNEIEDIKANLWNGKEVLLINGMGGIGKTTLAEVYVESYYNDYKHIAWVTVEENFKEALFSNFTLLQKLSLEKIPKENQFSACLNKLCNIDGPNLLVLDNAQQGLAEYYNRLPKAPNWHVLVTSRKIIEPFYKIEIGSLSIQDSIALFKKHCSAYEDNQIEDLVKKVGQHTLTIEVLAKAAQRNNWGIEKAYNALGADAMAGIRVGHSGYNKIENIKTYLTEIFNASNLNEKEKWVLKQFTALPTEEFEGDILYNLLQVEKLDWKDNFYAILEDLYESGLLKKNEMERSYKLHSVLKEVFKGSLKPELGDIRQLLITVTALLNYDQSKDNPVERFPFVPLGDSILELFKTEKDPDISHIQNNLALVYSDLGEYERARDLLEAALKSAIDNFGEKHPTVAVSKSNLANVYRNLEEYEKARDLWNSSYLLFKNALGENHPYTKKVKIYLNSLDNIK